MMCLAPGGHPCCHHHVPFPTTTHRVSRVSSMRWMPTTYTAVLVTLARVLVKREMGEAVLDILLFC